MKWLEFFAANKGWRECLLGKVRKRSGKLPITYVYNLTRCDPMEELKLNIALDGCMGFLLGMNPHLASDDGHVCEAVEEFRAQCLARHLPRCHFFFSERVFSASF